MCILGRCQSGQSPTGARLLPCHPRRLRPRGALLDGSTNELQKPAPPIVSRVRSLALQSLDPGIADDALIIRGARLVGLAYCSAHAASVLLVHLALLGGGEFMPDRVGIFIDGPNLYGGAHDLMGDGRLDVPSLATYIARGRPIAELVYWTGQLKQDIDPVKYANQQKFFDDILKRTPNSRIGRATLMPRGRIWIEKGVDVGVAIDAATGAWENRWDVGIVVSGDGDLAGLGPLLHKIGKRFEVVHCDGALSGLLEAEADECRNLTQKILKYYR